MTTDDVSKESSSHFVFPQSEEDARGKVAGVYGGLTLRDYFAVHALGSVAVCIVAGVENPQVGSEHMIAVAAYQMADAMLEARK